MARGAHKLIREGALLVEGPEDVLADLGIAHAGGPAPSEAGEAATDDERRVLDALRGETLGAEELSTRLARPLARVLVDLVELEMRGAVARTPGGFYRRTSA